MWIMIIGIGSLLAVVAIITAVVKISNSYRLKASRAGYGSLGEYLKGTPRSDEEKRDAVDLALKGLVLCLIGLVFPPLLLFGILPLFYGARKIAYSAMGFGLFDDANSQDG